MRVALGSDHAGYALRRHLHNVVLDLGHEAQDLGCHSTASVSYVDFAKSVVDELHRDSAAFGILVCGTGLGVSMAANRFAHIRAAVCHHEFSAQMARAHNNANILCLGERMIGVGLAESILKTFLGTPFAGGRHESRLVQLARLTDPL